MIMKWLIMAGAAAAALAGASTLKENAVAAAEVPRARDGNIAIQEELCAARKARTQAAYDLFIARHPQHPLAEVARKERRQLIDKQDGR